MSTVTTIRPASRGAGFQAPPVRSAAVGAAIDPIRVLRRHALGIIIAAILGAVLGMAAFIALDRYYPLYTGQALFEIRPSLQKAAQIGVIDSADDNLVFRIGQTETYMLSSRGVLEAALKDPLVRTQTEWYRKFVTLGSDGVTEDFNSTKAADELEEDIRTSVVRGSNLFSVSWSAHNPKDVPIVLNAIAAAYLADRRERDFSVYKTNVFEFGKQLKSTQNELEDLTSEIQSLIRTAGITTLDDVRFSAQYLKVEELTKQLAEVANQLNFAMTSKQLTDAKLTGKMEPSAQDRMQAERDPTMMEQMANLQALKTELRRRYERLQPDNPMITNLEQTIRATEEQRDANITQLIRRNLLAMKRNFEEQVEQYRNSLTQIDEELEKNKKLVQDLAAQQAKYDALRMRREQLEAQRTANLQLINELELMRVRADASRVQLARSALAPREPSFPKVQIVVPLGILLFTGVMVGIVFLRELVDHRVKSVSDLAVLPGAHVLGAIPDLDDDPTRTEAAELVVTKHPMSVLSESYRQVVTSLLPLMDRNGHQTLLIVGGLPGSGTTTAVTNVAAACAAAGKSVLVIDANFRRPRLAQAMGLNAELPGLSDLLNGTTTMDQAIVDAGEGISVIPSGTPATRVFDRLNNGTFDGLVSELRGRYDMIIFDAPPVIVAGDAMVLANKVDAAMLVVRAQQEHRGLVARMINRLSDARCELLGVLLNRPRGIAGGYLKKNYATMAEYGTSAPR